MPESGDDGDTAPGATPRGSQSVAGYPFRLSTRNSAELPGAHLARECPDHTPSGVHEAYMRFAGELEFEEQNRRVFAIAAKTTLGILRDYVR